MRASQGTQANLETRNLDPVTSENASLPTVSADLQLDNSNAMTLSSSNPVGPDEPENSNSSSAQTSSTNLGTLGSGSVSASADLQTLLAGVHRRLFEGQDQSPE